MWRKVVIGIGVVFCLSVVAAVLFPFMVHARSYSGPGIIREALLIDSRGKLAANRRVTLNLRGHGPSVVAQTDSLGRLDLQGKDYYVDAIVGFERSYPTSPTADKRVRPTFWEVDPKTRSTWIGSWKGGRPKISWPTPEHPDLDVR